MKRFMVTSLVAVVAVGMVLPGFAAELELRFPLGRMVVQRGPQPLVLERTAFQTNETFDLAVIRSGEGDLPGGDLTLTLTAADGTKSVFTFTVPAVRAVDGLARATETFHLNGRLLRPGAYTVTVACDGASVERAFDVFSHVRMSPFVNGDWNSSAGRIPGEHVLYHKMGEESLGFNMVYSEFRHGMLHNVEATIRGGMDHGQICTQSGAHQMDLRQECDWSDPYVLGGGAARGVVQAFISRTAPNAIGVHLYDEPGLTWEGQNGPFAVSAQYRSYRIAFDYDPFPIGELKVGDESAYDQWSHFMLWHLSFMDAAWKNCQFAISWAQPQLMTLTQSVYGYPCYADGYYFNVVRSLPVISGHGGYSDGMGGYMYAAVHMELGRVRDLNKPYWYMPSWYGMDSDQTRLEQYLSFQAGVQGQFKPPTYEPQKPDQCVNTVGIIEANKVQMRLGTIFHEMPVKRPTVAMLYSMSQNLHGAVSAVIAKDLNLAGYVGGGHRYAHHMLYYASKLIQTPMHPVVEEDILDGTLAKNHTVLILTGIDYLRPDVLAAVEAFAATGGTVLLSDECKQKVQGAKPVGAAMPIDHAYKAGKAWGSLEYHLYGSFGGFAEALTDYNKALVAALKGCGVEPVIQTDQPGISATVQGEGDVEYVFLVNATSNARAAYEYVKALDAEAAKVNKVPVLNAMKSVNATIALAGDGRPVYDAIHGGAFLGLEKKNGQLTGTLRFGPGAMKVIARTARPIGGVQLVTPTLFADMTLPTDPIRVNVGAILVDDQKDILSAAVPMEIHVTDSMGVVRYNLLRASNAGMLRLTLPLAANDASGTWTVTVRELLTGQTATKTFVYTPPGQCGAIASATRRALYFGNDRENVFRFFKIHQNVTIVIGASEFNLAAAERIRQIVAPWGVTCTIVAAKDHAAGRKIDPAGLKTWVGLNPGGRGNNEQPLPVTQGFDIEGPVILVGNPEDHPMIQFGRDMGFLAYTPEKDVLPGRGRGMIAWTSNMVGFFNQESVTLIAYDAAGMSEAVGTMYEACAGIDPLMATVMPKTAAVQAVKALPATPKPFAVVWKTVLDDRVDGLNVAHDRNSEVGETIVAISHDGTVVLLDPATGNIKLRSAIPQEIGQDKTAESVKSLGGGAALTDEQAKAFDLPNFIPKKAVKLGNLTIVGYWGGLCLAFDADGKPVARTLLPNDITAMTVAGDTAIIGLADGAVVAVKAPGK